MNDRLFKNSETASNEKPRHHLGWQLTGRCNHACRYCLRRRTDRPTVELGQEDCEKILESYLDFVAKNGMMASIMFSGGNPMLRPDLPALLRRTLRARQENTLDHTTILANPETLDDAAVANIAECKVDLVFLSLDGRKENNDRMRGPGSFDAAVAGIKNLSDAGVPVNVKYTLCRYNVQDVAYTRELVASLGAKRMAIGILSEPDDAGDLSDLLLTSAEYREFLLGELRYFESPSAGQSSETDGQLRFNRGLYALLFYELGRYDEFQERVRRTPTRPGAFGPMHGGQRRGMFVVWEDGSVHASNPNAQPPLGQVPLESFQTIHERVMAAGGYQSFARMRTPMDPKDSNPTNAACKTCTVREHCRGDNHYCWKLA